ncbi:MAG: hypothetical protein IT328_25165 [Caldilineaceae bacterium]|nr:hypothetical protein [Caldilineaceae bacterium]
MEPLTSRPAGEQAAANEVPQSVSNPPAYSASWLDYFFDWVRALPMPVWLFYLCLCLLLLLLFSGLSWLEGLQPLGFTLLLAVDKAAYIVYYLALMHYLDGTAGRALSQFRPLLQADESDFARLHYELTTLPARSTLLAGGIGILITIISLQFAPADPILAQVVRQPSTQLAFLVGNAILAICVYHTIRQLGMVSRIHATVAYLNFYRRGPVYAFSRLTARTALGWILGISLGLSPRIAPFLSTEHMSWFWLLWLPIVPLAALVFVLPLVGVHRLLAREKARLQDDVEQRVEAVLLRVHRQQDADKLGDVSELKTLLDTLLVEREMAAKLPTWPWQPGTLAGFGSALLLPLAIWLLQQLLMGWFPGN